MSTPPAKEEPVCRRCGACCAMEIPLTLLDISRIAAYLGHPSATVFADCLEPRILDRQPLFLLAKRPSGFCIFLDEGNACRIHPVKPNPCRFYFCGHRQTAGTMPWTVFCTDPECRAALWEQSVAAMVTRAYINRHGRRWHADDFQRALSGINANIVSSDTQTIRLARDLEHHPRALIYDCSHCDRQGVCATETIVTLDDIQRIAAYQGITHREFFTRYLDPASSERTGCLRLKREHHCTFAGADGTCGIEEVRPMFCRFVPCPQRVRSAEELECFYLGAGRIEEQFRHQLALALTREYTAACGARYDERRMTRELYHLDQLLADDDQRSEFCRRIAPYRYVDDAC
ncbi:MAG: YkgJ family cysteine cluster protein [Deltaproteobacteria bacterium]|nr:YkgJ family cysteine cluster protein [Candidatus Anaeroferrophillacea bacterium]